VTAVHLRLFFHPLASFCWKVLIALYENDTPFEPHIVDLADPASAEAFKRIWPIGKFPILCDDLRGHTIPESTVIVEYLARHYPGRTQLVPSEPDRAWQTRLSDRLYDHYVHHPMQKIVTDKLRPEASRDPYGIEEARALLRTSLGLIDRDLASQTWATGAAFTMADCAAAPALFYADKVVPLSPTYPNAAAYLDRLKQRPSFARVLDEAEPYFRLFPG
jgi:glutathione S-transferase